MAIVVPKDGDIISAGTFGAPVANEVNRITPIATVTAWQALPLSNNATVFNIPPSCRKVGDRVQLKGNSASGTAGSTIATLPTGFRPLAVVEMLAYQYNGGWVYCNITIDTNGQLKYINPPNISANTANVSLWGLSFPTT